MEGVALSVPNINDGIPIIPHEGIAD